MRSHCTTKINKYDMLDEGEDVSSNYESRVMVQIMNERWAV